MSAKARRKGANGEREVVHFLKDRLGDVVVSRNITQVRDGGDDIQLDPFSIEIKRQEKISLKKWWEQTSANAGDKKPALFLRWSRGPWLVVQTADDWVQANREEIVEQFERS